MSEAVVIIVRLKRRNGSAEKLYPYSFKPVASVLNPVSVMEDFQTIPRCFELLIDIPIKIPRRFQYPIPKFYYRNFRVF